MNMNFQLTNLNRFNQSAQLNQSPRTGTSAAMARMEALAQMASEQAQMSAQTNFDSLQLSPMALALMGGSGNDTMAVNDGPYGRSFAEGTSSVGAERKQATVDDGPFGRSFAEGTSSPGGRGNDRITRSNFRDTFGP